MSTLSPNMNLPVSTIGVDSGLNWETNLNAALSIVDQHDHSSGKGVQINPAGINLNADLPFNGNNATLLRTTRFSPQSVPIPNAGSDIGEIYVSGNELYYNDVTGGHQVQLTSNGTVNATSSGISSGTASAAFSAGVLLVKSSSTSYGNVALESVLLANSGNLTNQLTLQAPTLSSSYSITLPTIPASKSFVAIDASGNLSSYVPVSQGITGSNIADQTVTRNNLVAVGQQVSSSTGAFSTTSNTPVNVVSVTITTSGRPVVLLLTSDGSGSQSLIYVQNTSIASAVIRFVNITTTNVPGTYQIPQFTTSTQSVSMGGLSCMDFPSAGTYTYQVQAYTSGSGTTVGIVSFHLVAYEL